MSDLSPYQLGILRHLRSSWPMKGSKYEDLPLNETDGSGSGRLDEKQDLFDRGLVEQHGRGRNVRVWITEAGTLAISSPEPIISGMPKHTIEVRITSSGARITKPGARYVVRRRGEEYEGAWLSDGEPTPAGHDDTFTEAEARLLLPFLRARGTAGRTSREATTPDGRLVARAKARLGLTGAGLAEAIGAHESALSRALHGELTDAHRKAIRDLLNAKKPKRSPRTR